MPLDPNQNKMYLRCPQTRTRTSCTIGPIKLQNRKTTVIFKLKGLCISDICGSQGFLGLNEKQQAPGKKKIKPSGLFPKYVPAFIVSYLYSIQSLFICLFVCLFVYLFVLKVKGEFITNDCLNHQESIDQAEPCKSFSDV